MSATDLRPPQNTASSARISRYNNNRLGAVYSSLHEFWVSRQAAANAVGGNVTIARRDAYSMILFDSSATTCISNDSTSSPDDLLDRIVSYRAGGGTDYTKALVAAQSLVVQHWGDGRYVIPACRASLLIMIDIPKDTCPHLPLRRRMHGLGCHHSFGLPRGHRPRVST